MNVDLRAGKQWQADAAPAGGVKGGIEEGAVQGKVQQRLPKVIDAVGGDRSAWP